MEPTPHDSRSPITEALIEIQAVLPPDVTSDTLVQVGPEEAYPTRGNLYVQDSTLVAGAGLSPASGPSLIGHSFQSRDGKQVLLARLNGFLFSRMQPYEGWEPFRNEARRLWEVYRAVTRPKAITRVALRYVNRLDIPRSDDAELKDYLRVLPDAGPIQMVSGFFMQLQVPQEDLQAMLFLNEALLTPSPPGVASILLDIDLFKAIELPQDDSVLWDFVEHLQTRTSRVFEECITERTQELIRSW